MDSVLLSIPGLENVARLLGRKAADPGGFMITAIFLTVWILVFAIGEYQPEVM